MQWLPLALLAVNAFIPSVYAIPGVRYLDQLGNLCQYFLFFSFFLTESHVEILRMHGQTYG